MPFVSQHVEILVIAQDVQNVADTFLVVKIQLISSFQVDVEDVINRGHYTNRLIFVENAKVWWVKQEIIQSIQRGFLVIVLHEIKPENFGCCEEDQLIVVVLCEEELDAGKPIKFELHLFLQRKSTTFFSVVNHNFCNLTLVFYQGLPQNHTNSFFISRCLQIQDFNIVPVRLNLPFLFCSICKVIIDSNFESVSHSIALQILEFFAYCSFKRVIINANFEIMIAPPCIDFEVWLASFESYSISNS